MATTFADAFDPDEVDVFTFDWTNILDDGETISTFTATPPAALVLVTSAVEGTETRAKLDANGATPATYEVLFRIVTSAGRELEETAKIKVKAR